jgi:hypothetical protein
MSQYAKLAEMCEYILENHFDSCLSQWLNDYIYFNRYELIDKKFWQLKFKKYDTK